MKDKDYLALIQTQRSHIDTLLRIIKHLQEEMIFALDVRTKEEERKRILRELIYWIDQLMVVEE